MLRDDKKSPQEINATEKSYKANGGNNLIANDAIRNSFIKDKIDKEKALEKNEIKDDDSLKGLNIFQKARLMMSLITVEPILACYVMPSVLSALATQNLYLEKACRVNLGFGDQVCDALTKRQTSNYTLEEEAVQTLVASVAGWKTVLQSFLPCGILIFLGAYSDRVGQRKFCMLLPIVGEFLTSIGLIVNTYFFYELPVEAAAVTEAIFPALTGGWFTMFMGVFSYIADVTTEEQRTLRIGIVNLFYSVGVPVGAALSGILVRKIGLYGVFSLSATLYVLSFIYGYYRIKEVKRTDLCVKKTNGCCEWLRDFFDTRYVKDTLMVAFKTGPNNRRLRVIMLVVVLCVVIGPIYGEMSVMYLFTRYRFNWNEVDFSMFSTYAMCTSLVGTLFSVGVFSHLLKFDDAIIGVISCTSKILSGFMYAFATKTWHIYIAPLIEIFNGTSFIAMRSMVSKLVEKDELGKVNSFFGVAEAMMPLVYAPMYTTVYTATIKSFPGAFFLLGGGLTVPAVLIFIWLYLANKKHISQTTQQDGNDKANLEEKQEKNGIDNKAYEAEERNKPTSKVDANSHEEVNTNLNQSQIEMGFTESMLCTSKL
ncbi:solute carrier family 46 member 3-like [Pararge aegeria]|uniref:Jg11099 protein n=3 Tax=Pararge aegeria TaxID=116150 RepID=A0A8S4SKD1_9NEOP|nr:solute carrier family 46 member 3-like [Pararge aegeria]XP_039750510.1 solute carrier family 46 member 3-like [Pararge aegeria]XP_039750511.1 solute carrier family 46 member 3-like [Pararge aegeria]XP_039750512.1 solute carrier family 46 member 3-like [Pararge aegeria]XP_039750513.1 solute carrier family 46 member 3-like [Pararge aegeria]XP_039750514.1 solute carrier family 46 member 3-like [Pararge aegeria]XP_039750515.1 solute carrier family 46 member 3-like [Pararge aegeria]CAH2266094.